MIEFDASNPYAARLRDQHYQMQDLLISVDELKAQITFLTLKRCNNRPNVAEAGINHQHTGAVHAPPQPPVDPQLAQVLAQRAT